MNYGAVLCRGEILAIPRISVFNVTDVLRQRKRPFLDIGAIPTELKKLIIRCWNEEAKDRPEFVTLYRELCVGEFEEMRSHLEQLSLGGSPSISSSQGLFSFFYIDMEVVELIVCLC